MLKLNKKIFKLLLSCVIFSMVIVSSAVYAKTLRIDLRGMGRSLDDVAGRDLIIWKVDERILSTDQRQDLVESLNDRADDSLTYDKMKLKSNSEGFLDYDFDKGTYYARVLSSKGKIDIYPFAFVAKADDEQIIYPKGHHETPPGEVELFKISSDEKPLQGAVFRLYRLVNGKEVLEKRDGLSEFVTDADGEIRIDNLLMGEYIFEEIEAPKGYRIKEKKTLFQINQSSTTHVRIVNYKEDEGGKVFRKVSSKTKLPIEGVKFVITNRSSGYDKRIKKDGKDLVLTSDKDGYFEVDNLPFGTYYLFEIKPAPGYYPLSSEKSFQIDEFSLDKVLFIENEHIEIKKHKIKKRIPKTGDISLILMSALGLICSIMGAVLIKENK